MDVSVFFVLFFLYGRLGRLALTAQLGVGAGFYLFFSSNSYNSLKYDISYAVSRSAVGPFKKVHAPNAPFLTT